MYCDACGARIEDGQNFCRACGKEAGVALPPRAVRPRVAAHMRVLAVLWIALGVLRVIPALVLISIGHWQFPSQLPSDVGSLLRPLLTAIGWALMLGAGACFVAGWGLLDRAPWARMYTIILAAISLIEVPMGTALGIYSLWVLMPQSSETEYHELART
jgi:hypothetical protein